jgi:hypothetical protein
MKDRLPGLKSETWATQISSLIEMWATRETPIPKKQPQVLRLVLAQRTRENSLRMTARYDVDFGFRA